MKQPRSVGLAIVLSLITFGIYGLYWMYCIHRDVHEVSGRRMSMGAGAAVVFAIITFGIFGIYWCYKMGQFLDEAKGAQGGYQGILYLILSIFGLDLIALALMQSELNRFVGYTDL